MGNTQRYAREGSRVIGGGYAETAESGKLSGEPGEPAASEPSDEERPVGRAEFDQLQVENDQLKKERDALVDRLARLQAEFENARKRAEKEKADFKDFAFGSVVEQFLPVRTTSNWR